MVLELVRQGRVYLERGQLVRAKDICGQIAAYLDYYLVGEQEWSIVEGFLKEVLLLQKIAAWKERGSQEYKTLEEFLESQTQTQTLGQGQGEGSSPNLDLIKKYIS
jgi:hypothetical protein